MRGRRLIAPAASLRRRNSTRVRYFFLPRAIACSSRSFSGRDKEARGDGELCGKSSGKVISSRRIKLIRPAVVSRAYFKCHRGAAVLSPALWKRLPPPPPSSPPKLLVVDVSLCEAVRVIGVSRRAKGDRERARECEEGGEKDAERQTEIAPRAERYERRNAEDVTFDVIPATQSRRRALLRESVNWRAACQLFRRETKTTPDIGEIGKGQTRASRRASAPRRDSTRRSERVSVGKSACIFVHLAL